LIELPPAGALVGLAKRAMPGVETLAIKTPADLDAARNLIAATGGTGQGEHTLDFSVAITPAKGIFTRAAGVDEGTAVKAGMRLGTIATNRDEHPVLAPASGPRGELILAEWLKYDGDIVAAGLPVARITSALEA
jgi:[acyl-carrier-protein] S-malonyltransferase